MAPANLGRIKVFLSRKEDTLIRIDPYQQARADDLIKEALVGRDVLLRVVVTSAIGTWISAEQSIKTALESFHHASSLKHMQLLAQVFF